MISRFDGDGLLVLRDNAGMPEKKQLLSNFRQLSDSLVIAPFSREAKQRSRESGLGVKDAEGARYHP
jgi:hypothetical protein